MGILMPNRPQKEKEESDFDKVLKGLQVANSITGTVADFNKIDQMKLDNEQRKIDQAYKDESKIREREKFQMDKEKFAAEKSRGFMSAKDPLTQELQAQRLEQMKRDKEPKDNQFKAATFGNRASDAEGSLADLKAGGFDRSNPLTAIGNAIVPKSLESQDFRKQSNAEKNFLTAVLRRESGATITADELKTGEDIYFDRANDSDEVKAQKAQTRQRAVQALLAEGGPANEMIAKRTDVVPPQTKQSQAQPLAAGVGLKQPKISDQDIQAVQWAKSNPGDPRAQQILKLHGIK